MNDAAVLVSIGTSQKPDLGIGRVVVTWLLHRAKDDRVCGSSACPDDTITSILE